VVIGGKRNTEAADLPAAAPGVNPAAAGDVTVDGGRGVAPGARAELLRGLAVLVAQRSGVTMAALRALRGGAVRHGELECGGG
jgi:hypothetical protein